MATKKGTKTQKVEAFVKKAPAKKVNKRATAKKSVVKKAPAKKVNKKIPRPVTSKKIDKPPVLKSEVKLPKNASVRMIEKAGVLQSEFDKYLRESAFKIAYVSGICFILVGAAYASSSTYLDNVKNLAAVSESDSTQVTEYDVSNALETDSVNEVAEEEFHEDVDKTETEIPPPAFEIIDQAPDVTVDNFSFLYSATNIKDTRIEVSNLDSKKLMPPINLESKSGGKYRAEIPANTYPGGLYRVVVYITALNKEIGTRAYAQNFYVDREVDGPESYTDTSNREEQSVDEFEITENDHRSTAEPVVNEEDSDEDVEDPIEINKFEIKIGDNKISNGVRVEIRKPAGFSNPELYARPTHSLSSKYITSAVLRNEKLVFLFDSNSSLPNGKYELYSLIKNSNQTLTSNSVFVSVYNTSAAVHTFNDTETTEDFDSTPDSPTTRETVLNTLESRRDFVVIENLERPTSTHKISREVENNFRDAINKNTNDLNTILKRYAAAQQTGDEILIEAVRKELQDKRREMVSETLKDEELRDYADDIDKELATEFKNLQTKIETFEKLRKEKTGGGSAKDTDKDGISDLDEENIFKTNPLSADSDNDGFTDGVEIVRGFNPTDERPEAVVNFRSPKESKLLTREDVLSVDTVIPIAEVKDAASTTAPIITEIRGKGLPNSYLTLFIFSQPTVVTVKTDEDGSFVYTFDKELEDGEHEVYVAVTDNTGDIIAQSNPFSFVKTAQAFTPVDAAEDDLISNETIAESTTGTYGVVAGMGLLALGLILVMLGVSLRSRDEESPELVTITSEDDSV